jgi:uncharacterized membrane protein
MIYLLVVLGILACSLSQLMLKKSANLHHKSRILEILNIRVIISYIIFFGAMLVNIWAMSNGLKLKEMSRLESLGYIFVPILSFIVLKESVSMRTWLATLIIIIGITIFYI